MTRPATLALAPGTAPATPGTGANTAPAPLFALDGALSRAGDGYFDWLDHVWAAAGCTHPVRLHGDIHTIDTHTGEILHTNSTEAMPDGVIYKPCGNRRTAVCPSCAETYRRDAYHLIRAGLIGGKTVPEAVTHHPAVFATFTAPSFGDVHTRHIRRHTCTNRADCTCRPEPCHARRTPQSCPHGYTLACFTRHTTDDPQLGQPLCPDCYDYSHQAVWNAHTGELWRRTKQAIERHLNHHSRALGLPRIRVSHGKVAEYQARGAIHFHALLRLDGIDPDNLDAVIPPPAGLTVADLDDAIHHAAGHVVFTTPPHPDQLDGWPITWGEQLDVRTIGGIGTDPMTDAMVAAYLAKYATKSTEITGHTSRRIDATTINHYANPTGTHTQRLIHACWKIGEHPDYQRLRRWAHMLGYGGHFLTKARRYSLTFAKLRAARITYRRTQTTGPEHTPITDHDDTASDETTTIITQLTYAGTGWKNTGDALLANTAADLACRRRQTAREETQPHSQSATQQAA